MSEQSMSVQAKPVRRVVTGTDENGHSFVISDSAAPKVHAHVSAAMTDIWVYQQNPALLSASLADGDAPFKFEPPHQGGHLRIVQTVARPPHYDPSNDPLAKPRHETVRAPGGAQYRGGQNAFSSPYHKSDTLDYGVVLEGERVLRLDEGDFPMRKHDVVVQLGNWHGWTNPTEDSTMAFVMMGWRVLP